MWKLPFRPPVFVVVYLQVVKTDLFVPSAVPIGSKLLETNRMTFYHLP